MKLHVSTYLRSSSGSRLVFQHFEEDIRIKCHKTIKIIKVIKNFLGRDQEQFLCVWIKVDPQLLQMLCTQI